MFNMNGACVKESVTWAVDDRNITVCKDKAEGWLYDGKRFPLYNLEVKDG